MYVINMWHIKVPGVISQYFTYFFKSLLGTYFFFKGVKGPWDHICAQVQSTRFSSSVAKDKDQ